MSMNFTAKIIKNGEITQIYRTHKIRRFLKKIRSIKFEDEDIKVYLKVDYGKHIDVYGKRTNFCNEGIYENADDFWWAFHAFTEK